MADGPVKIDVGAKASLEVKAEVPKEAAGRLVEALTDLIRPWSESRGLKADLIRLQREDVALKIAQKAAARIAFEAKEVHPIPIKTIVPLLEHGSQEDPQDDLMIDLWANLLASSATTDAVSPRFISLLSEINGRQAKLLMDIYNHRIPGSATGSVHKFCDVFLGACIRGPDNLPTKQAMQILASGLGRPGLISVNGIVRISQSKTYSLFTAENEAHMVDLDILESLGLIDFQNYTSSNVNKLTLQVHRSTVTFLGSALMELVGVATDIDPED